METIFIITGHGNYGTGMKSNLSFITGDQSDVYGIDFVENETESDLVVTFEHIIQNHHTSNVIFVCDLLGGTPFRAAASIAKRRNEIEIVCGIGVGALIELIFMKNSMTPSDIACALVDKTKENCIRFEMLQQKNMHNQEIDYDFGI